MNVEYINPFIESVFELFSTMLQAEAKRGQVAVTRNGALSPRDITAFIGLSGPIRGTVALAFPTDTALNIVNGLLGTDTRIVDNTVCDGIAEVVNIVAGSAKAKLHFDDDQPIDLSLPTVVRGSNYEVNYPTGSFWLEVPFETSLGHFGMRVTFETTKKGGVA